MVLAVVAASSVGAQDGDEPEAGTQVVDVVQVSGHVDPILVEFVGDRVAEADAGFADGEVLALVLQVNSPGAVVGDDDLAALHELIGEADVPIGVWVGPSGSSAKGGAAVLLAAADLAGLAPGSRLGDIGSGIEGGPEELLGPGTAEVVERTVGSEEALELGLVDTTAPTLGDFVLAMEDVGLISEFTEVVAGDEGAQQRQIVERVRLSRLGLIDQLFHTVASSNIAYLLLLAGLGLLLLELYTAGVGIAAGTGVVALLLASYGLGVLPVRPWALALLILAAVAYAVDVQAGVPRFWTAAGTVALVVGTIFLFDGVGMSWLAQVAGVGAMLLLVLGAMPNLVRTRFGTNTLGREWMIGEQAEVVEAVAPDGVVVVREARWPARTNRATPLSVGDSARIVALDGPTLEVEPLEGAARDHRERRRDPSTSA